MVCVCECIPRIAKSHLKIAIPQVTNPAFCLQVLGILLSDQSVFSLALQFVEQCTVVKTWIPAVLVKYLNKIFNPVQSVSLGFTVAGQSSHLSRPTD